MRKLLAAVLLIALVATGAAGCGARDDSTQEATPLGAASASATATQTPSVESSEAASTSDTDADVSNSDAEAIERELEAIGAELDALALPDDTDFRDIDSALGQ